MFNNVWKYATPGIPDELFTTVENVPLTKQDVRVISLSKLKLMPEMTIWDIGGGTGSMSIEMAIIAVDSKIFAIEQNLSAVDVMRQNIEKFQVNNVSVIEGIAPTALEGLPTPQRVFIGGGGASLQSILVDVHNNIASYGIVVVNAVTIETLADTLKFFELNDYKNIECIGVSISKAKTLGSRHIFAPNNTVYVISAEKGD